MKTIIVVCIHDRYENLKKWLHSWSLCNKENAKLFIVHNTDESDTMFWRILCESSGAFYIKRQNIGFETAIIQDIFLGKMLDEQKWDNFIFCTDDTLPMKKDFISQYTNEISKSDVGAVCMEISGVYAPHIRTTGWIIRKDVSKKIKWAFVPVENKGQCYHFEHQGGELTLYSQLLLLGYRVVQPDIPRNSVFWDTHHNLHFDRWNEWYKEFPGYET